MAHKSKSRKSRIKGAERSAALGALLSVVAVLLIYGLLSGLAAVAVGGGVLPSGIGERLRLAWVGLAKLFGQAGAFFRLHGNTIVLIVGIMAIGAVAGVATYMLKRESRSTRSSHSARRVRRKRRK